jgi:hypothetical protein
MTDTEKLEICKMVYAAEHCQMIDCPVDKDCFECIEKRYKTSKEVRHETAGNTEIKIM